MATTPGRISGELLKADLIWTDLEADPPRYQLKFESDLLTLDTQYNAVGINTDGPVEPLSVAGTTQTTNLISTDGLVGLSPGMLISVSGNSITTADNLNLSASNYVFANIITTDDIELANNSISALTENASIGLEPDGTGTVDIHSDVNVLDSNNLYAQGNITLSGNLIIGNSPTDTVDFNANIASNIVPNITDTHSLGSNNITGKWPAVWPLLLNGETISTTSIGTGSLNLTLRPNNILYVGTNGNDTNEGDHQNSPYATIAHALLQAQSGDVVYIYPGTYTEITPLTVPAGVHVKGVGLRSVTIVPDATTNDTDIFLLNGETTVSDLTIKDFYYNSGSNTGYAFRFAAGMRVYTRSPYVQNISVITSETTTGALDAGRGALVDGSVANTLTKEASMLFHSVTFITPNANGLTMTNGVRVEWLNSFTYFANIGLYALNGAGRYDANTLTTRYGAELRSISSANVYGNVGAQVEGSSCLMYLINHNFAYIGAGTDVNNDPSLNNAANETLEYVSGKIYYQSLDNKGNFQVGDAFKVSFTTGDASISGITTTASGTTSVNFTSAESETLVNAELVATGSLKFSGNTISNFNADDINLASHTNEIILFQDVYATQNFKVNNDFTIGGTLTLGNQPFDIVEFDADVEYDLRPSTTDTYNLGSLANQWLSTKVIELDIGNTLKISGHTVESLASGIDLELIPNGAGEVSISSNTVVENDLTVSTDTNVKATNITGAVDLIGAVNRTGDINQTGTIGQTGNLDVTSTAEFANVTISTNTVSTITPGTDLKLMAADTGLVYIPADNVLVSQNVTVNDTVQAGSVTVHGTTTANKFDNGDITIEDNIIQTTVGNNDLELGAATTGLVRADLDSVEFDQDLTVDNITALKNTVIGSTTLASSLSFSSSNYLSLSAAQTIGTQAYTFECFFYTASNGLQTILGATATGGMSIWLFGDGTNPVTIIQIDRSYVDAAQYTVSPITLNTWHHIAVTRDSANNTSVFLDGVKATGSASNATNYTGTSGFIGAVAGSSYFFTGYLTQIKLAVGSNYYDPTAASISVPTAVLTTSTNTKLLLIVANSGAYLTDTSGTQTVSNIGGVTYLATGPSTSDITHVGDYNQTGSTLQTGNRSISTTLDVDSSAYFDDIAFITNRIITDTADTDLSLKAAGAGKVVFNDNVTFSQAATIGTLVTNGLTNSGTITSDFFTNNNIEINDNYITTIVGDDNLILSGISTGGPKLEKVKFNGTTISTETVNEGIIFSTPSSNLVITGTNALQIPVGTTADRTTLTQGEFRFNTTDSLFRGFSTATVSFSGVYSANKLTNVLTHPTNNTLIFTTNNATAMTMSTGGITVSRLDADNNLSISGNTISTLTTDSNLVLTPNGTGEVVMGDLSFGVSEITNLNATTPIIFQNLGNGYVEFAGTAGITLPTGDNDARPATPQVGDLRYNTQLSIAEIFNGVEYASLAGTGAELLSAAEVQELSNLLSLVFG